MLAHTSLNSNKSSNDDTTNDSIKHYEYVRNLFKKSNDNDDNKSDDDNVYNDDSSISSIDSDIKREYNLDAAEQEYSDDNVPYDECRTSESESSDADDNGSDLADFIVTDDALEDEKDKEEQNDEGNEEQHDKEEGKEEQNNEDNKKEREEDKGAGKEEQNNEDNEKEREEHEVAEQEAVENKDVDDEQEKVANKNYNKRYIEEDEDGKPVRTKTNISKNNAFNKSFEVGKNKRNISTKHIVPQSEEKENIKSKKAHMKNVEETIILDTSGSTSSVKIKRKSYVDEIEQNMIKQLNKSEIHRRKKSKATCISLECSTSKMNSSEEKLMSDIETTASALEVADEKLNSMSETTQLKRKKSRKNSILKEDMSFKKPKRIDNKEKILHTSLPSDLLEQVGKMKPMTEMIELNKTMNVTHTETPTIRDLRKEKLNESAPELKLKTETCQLQKRQLSKKEGYIAQKKIYEDSDKEVPNLAALFNDNIQELSQQKQKKRKKQVEETSNENITETILLQDIVESDISKQKTKKKKEKSNKLSQVLTIENTTYKNMCQLTEKKKISVTEREKDAKEDNVQQEDICKKEKGKLHLVHDEAQHSKKKKDKTVTSIECGDISPTENIIAKKTAKQQKVLNSKVILSKQLLKKQINKQEEREMKKEKKNPLLQTEALKCKSKSSKKIESEKLQLQNVLLEMVESKNAVFVKTRNEALEVMKSATERIKQNKELEKRKKKRREDTVNTIQEQNMEAHIKRKKTGKRIEEQKQDIFPSHMGGLKRLSDNVIDKLSDVPTRVKRRKLLQNKEQVMPPLSAENPKFESRVKNSSFISLSSNGGTTQFAVVNLSKGKKQPSKTVASVMSYRQRMLDRNNREPTSTYLMYLRKRNAVSKDKIFNNAF